MNRYYLEIKFEFSRFKNSEDKIIESFENYLRCKLLDTKIDKELDKNLKYLKKIRMKI